MDPEDRHQVEGALLSETGGTATRVAAVLAAYNRRDLNLAWRPFKTVLVEPGDAPGPATPWLTPYVHRGVRLALERTPLGRPRRAMS
jgi:hypothetical protein